jgi:hypothetical protein
MNFFADARVYTHGHRECGGKKDLYRRYNLAVKVLYESFSRIPALPGAKAPF